MKTLIFDAIVKRKYRISISRDEDTLLYHIVVEQLRKGRYYIVETTECYSHDSAFKVFYMYICVYSGVLINMYG